MNKTDAAEVLGRWIAGRAIEQGLHGVSPGMVDINMTMARHPSMSGRKTEHLHLAALAEPAPSRVLREAREDLRCRR